MPQEQVEYYCPICRQHHATGNPDVKTQILHTVVQLERTYGRAHTSSVAAHVSLSEVQTWRYLKDMEADGRIQRIGQRGGWRRAA